MAYQTSIQSVKNLLKPETTSAINSLLPYAEGISVKGDIYTQKELINLYGEHLKDMSISDIRFDLCFENPTFND